MNILNFFQLVSIISVDYPIALILGLLSFFLLLKKFSKNFLVSFLYAVIIFIIFIIILFPILNNIGFYKYIIYNLNISITGLFNLIATKLILHK